jgi:hypothetical protein
MLEIRLGIELGIILKNGLISAWFVVWFEVIQKVRKSFKMLATAAVVCLALGAVAFVYACSQDGATANANEKQMGSQNMPTFFESHNITSPNNVTMPWGHMRRMPQMRANGLQLPEGFSQNATLSTVNGTLVSEVWDMLVLDTTSGQIRVSLPKDWTMDNEVVGRVSLFNGTFASPGQNLTVKVLESSVFGNTSFSINEMLGYEVINVTGAQAYAVLPFNIQPNS